MKRVSMMSLFVLFCTVVPEAQTFDITGSYQGGDGGLQVRIVVQNEGSGEYRFVFMKLEEVSPVLESGISRTGEYLLPIGDETIRLLFSEDRCVFFNEDKTYTFTKRFGTPGTIPGKYVSVQEEDVELVLLAEVTGTGYAFSFEAWETGHVFKAAIQESDMFSMETDWGEAFTLEFFPDGVSFSPETMEPIVLDKE